ncbi:MAG: hypothetical protein OXQ90_03685 [Gammaproteobacteria bacterium]|nr:hypothetical protein [Gammaproteobacteria bacterium]
MVEQWNRPDVEGTVGTVVEFLMGQNGRIEFYYCEERKDRESPGCRHRRVARWVALSAGVVGARAGRYVAAGTDTVGEEGLELS